MVYYTYVPSVEFIGCLDARKVSVSDNKVRGIED